VADSTDGRPPADLDDIRTTTREVGDEGGGPGEVEIEVDRIPGEGREADETWRPAEERRDVTVHDETGERRRNP
jgi:hypothetical protein